MQETLMNVALDRFDLPDTDAAQVALDYAENHEEPAIFRHSVRCYLIGRDLIQDSARGEIDDEVLFLACVLHDIGLTVIGNRSQRFELDGADVAAEHLTGSGLSEARLKAVWTAIALHTTPDIAHRLSPEAGLLSAAAPIDSGVQPGGVPARYRALAAQLLPHDGVQQVLLERTFAQTLADPRKAVPFTLPGELHRQMTGQEYVDFRAMLA